MNRGGGGVEGRLNIYRQWESTFRPASSCFALQKAVCAEAELGAAIFRAAPEPVFLSVGAKNRSHLIFKVLVLTIMNYIQFKKINVTQKIFFVIKN